MSPERSNKLNIFGKDSPYKVTGKQAAKPEDGTESGGEPIRSDERTPKEQNPGDTRGVEAMEKLADLEQQTLDVEYMERNVGDWNNKDSDDSNNDGDGNDQND